MHKQSAFKLAAITRIYLISTAAILLITGLLKLISATQGFGYLTLTNPVFGFLSNRHLVLISAAVEVAVALFICRRTSAEGLTAVAWLAMLLITYRIGLFIINYQGPCLCLGWSLAWTGLSKSFERLIAGVILTWCSLSYCFLSFRRIITHVHECSAHSKAAD